MSGYADDAESGDPDGLPLLSKPFTADQIERAVAGALARAVRPPAEPQTTTG